MKRNWVFERNSSPDSSSASDYAPQTRTWQLLRRARNCWSRRSILDRGRPLSDCRRFTDGSRGEDARLAGVRWTLSDFSRTASSITAKSGRRVLRGLWAKERIDEEVCTSGNPIAFEFCRLFVLPRSSPRSGHAREYSTGSSRTSKMHSIERGYVVGRKGDVWCIAAYSAIARIRVNNGFPK